MAIFGTWKLHHTVYLQYPVAILPVQVLYLAIQRVYRLFLTGSYIVCNRNLSLLLLERKDLIFSLPPDKETL